MTRIAITAGATAGSKRRAATHYNGRAIEDVLGSAYTTQHGEEVYEYTFSFDDLPVNGLDAAIPLIPANARIVSSEIKVLTAMDGTVGTITMGLEEPDGTVIDVDGLDVAVAQATLVAGATVAGDGALIGTVVTVASNLLVTTGGTVTAGKFRVRIVTDPRRDRA